MCFAAGKSSGSTLNTSGALARALPTGQASCLCLVACQSDRVADEVIEQPTKVSSKSRSAVGLPQCYLPLQSTGEIASETPRVHHTARRRGCVAAGGACYVEK